jgi:FAD dependent oxidoreductase
VIGFQRCGSTLRCASRHARYQDLSLSCAAGREADLQRIIIVGGGLAGLSTAFHLLQQRQERKITSPLELTILDKCQVGMGGASTVAGGYVLVLTRKRSTYGDVFLLFLFESLMISTYLLLLIEPRS